MNENRKARERWVELIDEIQVCPSVWQMGERRWTLCERASERECDASLLDVCSITLCHSSIPAVRVCINSLSYFHFSSHAAAHMALRGRSPIDRPQNPGRDLARPKDTIAYCTHTQGPIRDGMSRIARDSASSYQRNS